jgi:hypothetical protein
MRGIQYAETVVGNERVVAMDHPLSRMMTVVFAGQSSPLDGKFGP